MARFARVVAPGLPHHVTQRGNARRTVYESDADRLVYLDLLETNARLHRVSILGYCLMSNHVHLVVVPPRADSMALMLRQTHGRYASYFNARRGGSGHLWQGRYYSCPLGASHLWVALPYAELNPVRAGLAQEPELYRWSSAALHCGRPAAGVPLRIDTELWREAWDTVAWRSFLDCADKAEDLEGLRTSTHTGRPLGSREFVEALERELGRSLVAQKGGRPAKRHEESDQPILAFV